MTENVSSQSENYSYPSWKYIFYSCIHRTPISRVVFTPFGELRRLLLHIARLDGLCPDTVHCRKFPTIMKQCSLEASIYHTITPRKRTYGGAHLVFETPPFLESLVLLGR